MQFHIDKKEFGIGDYRWLNNKAYMRLGVTVEHPQFLSLPGDSGFWGQAVVINNNHITLNGQYTVSINMILITVQRTGNKNFYDFEAQGSGRS